MKQNPRPLAALAAVAALALPGMPLAQAQVTPQTLQSISMPNKVVTPIGQLEFFDGVPTDATSTSSTTTSTGCAASRSILEQPGRRRL